MVTNQMFQGRVRHALRNQRHRGQNRRQRDRRRENRCTNRDKDKLLSDRSLVVPVHEMSVRLSLGATLIVVSISAAVLPTSFGREGTPIC